MLRSLYAVMLSCIIAHVHAQDSSNPLKFSALTGDFYIYETYNLYNGERIPANGMYVVTTQGVVLFDTPWDTTQFQPLLDSIAARHGKQVTMAFATHFHDDRTAGLAYYRSKGIRTFTTALTDSLSANTGKKRAEFLIENDSTFTVGQYAFEVFYPGHGHAPDNIVIWFAKEKILYGGCLIKSTDDTTLGYLGDADPLAYATTVKKVQQKCTAPQYVIPGHGSWASTKSVEHTYKMAKKLEKKALKKI